MTTPFHVNPVFPKALRDGITQSWFRKGIRLFGDLCKEGVLEPFEELSERFDHDRKNFYKYLQLRHYILTERGKNFYLSCP